MALVLSLKKGEDFYVGDDKFSITEIYDDGHFLVRNDQTGAVYDVVSSQNTEIMPDVLLSAGDKPQPVIARVTINARPDIMVLRGDKYRNPPEHIRRKQRHGK